MPGRSRLRQYIFSLLLIAVVLLFVIYPLFYIIEGSLWVGGEGEKTLSVALFRQLFANPAIRLSLWNSLKLALITTALTALLTTPLAFFSTHYDFRGKNLFAGLLLVPIVLPPFVGALGVQQFFARFGSFNIILERLGLISGPIDWLAGGGFWGVVILQVLHLYPIMYLNVCAGLGAVDPAMEEAARNLGASGWRVLRTVTLPLAWPGYFAGAAITFIWSFTDLGTPLIFQYRQVAAVHIFDKIKDIHSNPIGYALVLTVLLISGLVFASAKATVGGRGYQMMARGHLETRRKPRSIWGHAGIIVFFGAVIFAALLPHIGVVLTSVSRRWLMTALPSEFTTESFEKLFQHTLTANSIRQSLWLSGLSMIVDVILGGAIAYFLVRGTVRGRAFLDALVMLPLAIPGLVLAFGYLNAFAGSGLDRFTTNWLGLPLNPRLNPGPLLVIAYAIRRLPLMVRAAYAGFQSSSETLEEASYNLGAGSWTTLRRVTIPLTSASLIAGAVLCFAFSMLEVSDSLILALEERFYPITKAIYSLSMRVGDGPAVACALGVIGMVLLATALIAAGALLGRRMGSLFRV